MAANSTNQGKNKAFEGNDDDDMKKMETDFDLLSFSESDEDKHENEADAKESEEEIRKRGYINILLLSETGVGKSTFINSVANYLTYRDFDVAEMEKLLVLIPAKFRISDENGRRREVSVGSSDKNEFLQAGESATQDVKSYIFPMGKAQPNIRLIDTPGMGDTRGPDRDYKNCDYILNYIGNLNELHAICCLYKPSNTRNTIYFQYCISEILSRLDKSATRNIIFVFTNARATNYGPGETYDILETNLDSIRAKSKVDIPLNDNYFCFDNEAFRYLAAVQENVKFSESDREKYKESWNKSLHRFEQMISYIKSIEPHLVQNTCAINEARRMITQLAQPLADIAELIQDNIDALQKHQEKLDIEHNSLEDLKKQMFMPIVDLEVVRLDQPVTVCTAKKCAQIYKVEDKNKWHYVQRCHNPCYLENVQAEIVDNAELLNCAAINQETGICKECECSYKVHMHVYYETKTTETKIENTNATKNIDDKEKFLADVKKLMDDMMVRKRELEAEHETIVTTCAKFTHFLQNNAITAFNDSYKDYIEYLITREQSLGLLTNKKTVVHLKKLLKKYEETKKLFDNNLQKNKASGQQLTNVTSKEILQSIQKLYKLKHTGMRIKQLYECQQFTRKREQQNTEYVFVRKTASKKNTRTKKGKMGGSKNTGILQKVGNFLGISNQKSGEKGKTDPYHSARGQFGSPQSMAQGFHEPRGNFANASFSYQNSPHQAQTIHKNPTGHNRIPSTQHNEPPTGQNLYQTTDSHQSLGANDEYKRNEYQSVHKSGRSESGDDRTKPEDGQYERQDDRNARHDARYEASEYQKDSNDDRYEDRSERKDQRNARYESKDDRNRRNDDRYDDRSVRYDDRYRRNDDRYDRNNDRNERYDSRYEHNDDRNVRYQDRYRRNDDRYERNDDRKMRDDDRYNRNDDRYSRNDNRYSRNDDRYNRYDDQYNRNDDRYNRYDDLYNRNGDRKMRDDDRYNRNDDRYNRNDNNRYSRNDDRYNRYDDQYNRNDDRYNRNDDRYNRYGDRKMRDDDRYNRNDDRFSRNDNRYTPNDDRYNRYDDQYNRKDDRYNRNDDRYDRNDGGDDRYERKYDRKRRSDDQNSDKDDRNSDDEERVYDYVKGRYSNRNGRQDGQNGVSKNRSQFENRSPDF